MALSNNTRGHPNHQSGDDLNLSIILAPVQVMICNVFVCNVWKAAGLFADIGDQVDLIPLIGSLLIFY